MMTTSYTTVTGGDISDAREEDDDRLKQQREELTEKWVQQLRDWFPHLHTKTYFVPPVHVNKLALDHLGHCGASQVTATKRSDFRDDRAQLTVERFLWAVCQRQGENEVMVVLSKFHLDNYLNKTLSGARGQKKKRRKSKMTAASDPKARSFFPTPTQPGLQRGDFDLLIVHRDYGFIIIEIKAVGDQTTPQQLEDVLGSQEIPEVLQQLNKRQRQLEIVTSDLAGWKIPLTKLAAFPNVRREKLQEVLKTPEYTQSEILSQELQQYLGTEQDMDNALTFWLCQDEVKGGVTSEGLVNDVGMTWWKGLLKQIKSKTTGFSGIAPDVYRQLVARVCGPMSTVEVCRGQGGVIHEARSISDAVHEMGTCCKRWILHREQVQCRSSPNPHLYLTGPPGSGKTLLLQLKAVDWAEEGDEVVIVRGPGNLPGHLVSQVLYGQVLSTLGDESLAQRVHLETITAWTDPEQFVSDMRKRWEDSRRYLRFLVDELWLAKPSGKILTLVREVLALLDTTSSSLNFELGKASGEGSGSAGEGSESAAHTELGKATGEGSWSAGEGSESAAHTEAVENMGLRMIQVLREIEERLKTVNTVHDKAKAILTDEIEKELEKITLVAENVRSILSEKGPRVCTDMYPAVGKMEEDLLNAQFYVEVLMSWLASPVLHSVLQEARGHQDVGLWCTGFWPNRRPEGYQLARLSTSIRCPPHVQKLLEQTEHLASHQEEKQYQYITTSTQDNPPLPAEGPPSAMVSRINHGLHVQQGEELKCVSQCQHCGTELADLLLNTLNVGKQNSKLNYNDVLIVGRALLPIQPDSALIHKLQENGIPTSVVVRGSDDLTPAELDSNTVLMTNTYNGHGLERTVVVFVPDVRFCQLACDADSDDVPSTDIEMERLGEINRMGLWFIVSRCQGHVVIFHV